MNAQELISGMINRAKTAPKEEQAEILADVVTITVVAGTTPSQWVESEPALVEIHLPKTVRLIQFSFGNNWRPYRRIGECVHYRVRTLRHEGAG